MQETVSRFETVKASVSLKAYADAHLEHVPGGLVCPACGSGTGKNHPGGRGTPAIGFYEGNTKWKCFSCGSGGDVFDLAGFIEGTEDRAEQLEAVCAWAGIPMGTRRDASTTPQGTALKQAKPTYAEGRERERRLIERARENMAEQIARGSGPGIDYMRSRGFTDEEVERFGIGYDPRGGRVVLPWSTRPGEWYHIDRDVTGRAAHKYEKPRRADVGEQPLYNPDAIGEKAFFVVEGVLDAYAVASCGLPVVALAGTGSTALAEALIGRKYRGVVMLALDEDEAGRRAETELEARLSGAGIATVRVDVSRPDGAAEDGEKHDPAQLFAEDRDTFSRRALAAHADGVRKAEESAEARYAEMLRRLQVVDAAEAVMRIYTLEDAEDPTPTGLRGLDRALNGGLRPGLIVLGAVSSLGKTTLSVQVADHIAESGRPVLFVTIEQSARELASKSLSRIMRQRTGGLSGTISSEDLQSRTERKTFGEARYAALLDACEAYTDAIAPRMHFLEGTEQPLVSDVAEAASRIAEHDGEPPVVFVDYLQLLAPESDRMTDKQATDRNITALRHLARDLRTPVFVISSLNRSSYSGAISLDSFKESGGIEYGADLLLGLQPYHMADQLKDVPEAKRKGKAEEIMEDMRGKAARPCEIVVLKYRNGRVPRHGIAVTFTPACSLIEDGVDEARL